ncbi:hypothetical protein GGTG_07384 [Gaeumannomyces tritici R3-111a-1]|uniref:Uncharacterized protein n=1 Tax=Gaeumannomyces tritici (strain R3-111a-1) TaxID=644352 RepID=J3P1I6_GAET3|nr:hypothetical protein GGTG_07384 [Gaeumannomyces tritici R3-111a-1]EJT77472.1 hypothetical protein GGTG_07384 [Gaeumannomyces tritici R3-111a-1]
MVPVFGSSIRVFCLVRLLLKAREWNNRGLRGLMAGPNVSFPEEAALPPLIAFGMFSGACPNFVERVCILGISLYRGGKVSLCKFDLLGEAIKGLACFVTEALFDGIYTLRNSSFVLLRQSRKNKKLFVTKGSITGLESAQCIDNFLRPLGNA